MTICSRVGYRAVSSQRICLSREHERAKPLRRRHGTRRHARNSTIGQTTKRGTFCYTELSTTRYPD